MGLFGEEHETHRYAVEGRSIACTVCRGDRFLSSHAQLHTAGLTFFHLEWLGKSAHQLLCDTCGQIMWFGKAPLAAD
jgi:hypothetical protein